MAFCDREVERLLVATERECCICHVRHAVSVHHIVLAADGGTDDIDNAIPLCPNCHDQVHGSAAPGRTTRKYSPAELRSFRDEQIEAVRRRRDGVGSLDTRSARRWQPPEGLQDDTGEVAGLLGSAGEGDPDADDQLPDYLMDGDRMRVRIRELEGRAALLGEVGLDGASGPLEAETAELRGLLPVVDGGYPLLDDFLWDLTVEACGFIVYPMDLTTDPSDVPDGVLRVWHGARQSSLFDELLVWGWGETTEDEGRLASMGGCILGVARGRRYWVASW